MNGDRRSDGPQRGVFQRIHSAEKSQYTVSPDFIDNAMVSIDLMDQNPKNFFNQGKRRFRTQVIGERSEPFHVAEHDGNLPQFFLDMGYVVGDARRFVLQ